MMFQCRASVADSAPVLNQYCVFGMDSRNVLNARLENLNNSTVAIPFKHKMLTQCCLIVGPASQTMIQH